MPSRPLPLSALLLASMIGCRGAPAAPSAESVIIPLASAEASAPSVSASAGDPGGPGTATSRATGQGIRIKLRQSARVAIESVTVSGGAVDDATSVTVRMGEKFDTCVKSAFEADHASIKDGATMSVTATIGRDGSVLSSTPSAGAGVSATAITCVLARVAAARFEPPAGGNATVVIELRMDVTL